MKLTPEFFNGFVRELYANHSMHLHPIEFPTLCERDQFMLGRAVGHLLVCNNLSCLRKVAPLPPMVYPHVPRLSNVVSLLTLGTDEEYEAFLEAINVLSDIPEDHRAEILYGVDRFSPEKDMFLDLHELTSDEDLAVMTEGTPLANDTHEEFVEHLSELIDLDTEIQESLIALFAALTEVNKRFAWRWPDNN